MKILSNKSPGIAGPALWDFHCCLSLDMGTRIGIGLCRPGFPGLELHDEWMGGLLLLLNPPYSHGWLFSKNQGDEPLVREL